MRIAITLVCWLLLAAAHAAVIPTEWVSKHYEQNPLVGKSFAYDAKLKRFVEAKLNFDEGASANHILIGEQHDNPDHHLIQAAIIEELVKAGKKPVLIFEMVPDRLRGVLQAASAKGDDDRLSRLEKKLEWEARGWYSWDIYRPIFKTALRHELEMLPGNLDRQLTRALSKEGKSALADFSVDLPALDIPLPENLRNSLFKELETSHCGLVPEKAFPAMALVQNARDSTMAQAMRTAANRNSPSTVLVAGNGHVRRDRGVPFRFHGGEARAESGEVLFVFGLIEVGKGLENASDYPLLNEAGDPLYDRVVFTPKYDVTDHCAALSEQFKIKKLKTK